MTEIMENVDEDGGRVFQRRQAGIGAEPIRGSPNALFERGIAEGIP
jgi:hypothetical protein